MNRIEKKVKETELLYGTSEPADIYEKMGIITVEHELPMCVNGFTITMNGMLFVVLNSELDYYRKRVTMAHELGHIILHKGTNSIELSCNTSFCVSRYEREADSFAVYLLMHSVLSQRDSFESLTAEEISMLAHIPMDMVERAFEEL